jgi:hypothetical protein
MTELDRESILQDRAEEVQRIQDRLEISRMAKSASTTRGSSRKVTAPGKTQKKSLKLDELKRKRESKKKRAEKVECDFVVEELRLKLDDACSLDLMTNTARPRRSQLVTATTRTLLAQTKTIRTRKPVERLEARKRPRRQPKTR